MSIESSPHRRRGILVPLIAALALAGCATATPYQPLGTRGASGGFTEQRLETNRYRVTFAGNDYTSRQRVENYLLFRAAELTLANGYDGFTIVRRDTDKNTSVYSSPGLYSSRGFGPYYAWQPYWRYYGGRFGWRSWDPWYGDPFWADSFDVRTVQRYEAMAEIVMFRGRRADPSSFDARQVIANLRPTIVVPR